MRLGYLADWAEDAGVAGLRGGSFSLCVAAAALDFASCFDSPKIRKNGLDLRKALTKASARCRKMPFGSDFAPFDARLNHSESTR